jgi:hypothetical protein
MESLWVYVLQLALIVLYVAGGGPAAYRLVDAVKRWRKWSGWKASALAYAVSALLAAAALVVEGVLVPDAMTPDNIAYLFIAFYAAAQLHYQKMKQEERMTSVEGS